MNVTQQQKNIAQQLITTGYQHAARSFSLIARQNVKVETEIVSVSSARESSIINKYGEQLTMLTTEIKGEMQGSSYLIFNEEECQEIYRACLPADNSTPTRKIMEEAILKEIDNILSAAVITEFSNYLNIRIHGDVPHLITAPRQTIIEKVASDLGASGDEVSQQFLIANTRFTFENRTDIQPQFFWRLTNQFIDLIQGHAPVK